MLDVHNLEERWLKYKIKTFIPYIVIFFSLIIIITVLFIFNSKSKINTEKKIVKPIKKLEKQVPKEKITIEKTILQPSYKFIENIKEINTQKIIKKDKQPKKVQSTIQIKRQNQNDDINIVLKRFHNNKNPSLSLFIAKKYYEQKNYKYAYKYAFITNELNNKIEDSWLIFIKSMIKLNKKEQAIKTLKQYIQHSDSYKAKLLLNNIYNGKFR